MTVLRCIGNILKKNLALNSSASAVASLSLDKVKLGETQSYLEMNPNYIRNSQAERELEERENKEKGESK